jgi:hypothetical protein
MPQSEARAWWADVQDVRETIERRRAAERAAQAHAPARRAVGDTAAHRDVRRPRSADGHQAVARPVRPARRSYAARRAQGASRRPLHLPSHPRPAEGRRTVEITGRTVPAPDVRAADGGPAAVSPEAAFPLRAARRRVSPSPAERLAHRPDRIAAWAAVLGLAMMIIAAL